MLFQNNILDYEKISFLKLMGDSLRNAQFHVSDIYKKISCTYCNEFNGQN